jgi:hypothetical protein
MVNPRSKHVTWPRGVNSQLSPYPVIRKTPLFAKVGFGEWTTAVPGHERKFS